MNPVPRSIIKLVRNEKIAFSRKAQDVLFSGRLTLDDLMSSILNGSVIKKERDETRKSRFKYTIVGPTLSGRLTYSCGKIIKYGTETQYFIITFHEAR